MTLGHHEITLPDAAATEKFARAMAEQLAVGDVILLSGPIGAGKTHFARSVILALLPEPEDVPSPTFTLVQTYDAPDAEIWHADLYRLTGPDEIVELGLTDAFQSAICLVEWPDRLAELAPASALSLTFHPDATTDQRRVTIAWQDDKWASKTQGVTHG